MNVAERTDVVAVLAAHQSERGQRIAQLGGQFERRVRPRRQVQADARHVQVAAFDGHLAERFDHRQRRQTTRRIFLH